MRKLYLILTLLLAFTFLTCDDDKTKDDPPPPPPPTLDQRLVGGRWYFWLTSNIDKPKTANGYYEFKNEFTFIFTKNNNPTTYSVYTKDNTVYRKDNNQALLKYQFYSQFPYQDINVSTDKLIYLNSVTGNNHIITCNVYVSSLELTDDIDYRWKIIRRFKDDGNTPYEFP